MAFFKIEQNEDGNEVSYWSIGAVQEDFKGEGTEVTVYGYKDKAARDAKKHPPMARKYHFSNEEYIAGADRAVLYSLIKQKPEFDGAQDV